MSRFRLSVFAAMLLLGQAASAAMVQKSLDYEVGGKKMQSVLVYDDAVKTARPGILLTPNWKGINDSAIAKAKTIAGKDYVILVADVYGVDVRPTDADHAGAAVKTMYEHRADLRARVNAALDQLKAQAGKAPLDGKHYGAIGFCFGGAATLDLARSGADVAGVATFHANLATDDAALAKNIKGKVLVMNGGDDKFVADQVGAFEQEMRDGGVDWQFINYGGAKHCFAEPDEHGEVKGCEYNERAYQRSFAQMHRFFDEVFAAK